MLKPSCVGLLKQQQDFYFGQVSPYHLCHVKLNFIPLRRQSSCVVRRWIYIVSLQLITQTLMRVGSLFWLGRIEHILRLLTLLWDWNPNKSGTKLDLRVWGPNLADWGWIRGRNLKSGSTPSKSAKSRGSNPFQGQKLALRREIYPFQGQIWPESGIIPF